MDPIEWQECNNCGIELIDSQHRDILALINSLRDHIGTRNRVEVEQVLNRLISTVIGHFEFEEQLMAGSGYGYLNAHKRLHDRFIERLVKYSQRFDAGECIVEELTTFLEQWVEHHMRDDRDFCSDVAAEMNAPKKREQGWFARTFGGKEKE